MAQHVMIPLGKEAWGIDVHCALPSPPPPPAANMSHAAALLCLHPPPSFVNSVTDKLTGTVSLGAAVFASVLIASGMPSETDVVRDTARLHVCVCVCVERGGG